MVDLHVVFGAIFDHLVVAVCRGTEKFVAVGLAPLSCPLFRCVNMPTLVAIGDKCKKKL